MNVLRSVWAFISGIIRLIFFLLKMFGLFIPLCYFAIAFAVNLITKGAVFQTPLYQILFYVGLALSVIFAFALFVKNVSKKDIRYDLKAWENELKKREKAVEERERALQNNIPAYAQPNVAAYYVPMAQPTPQPMVAPIVQPVAHPVATPIAPAAYPPPASPYYGAEAPAAQPAPAEAPTPVAEAPRPAVYPPYAEPLRPAAPAPAEAIMVPAAEAPRPAEQPSALSIAPLTPQEKQSEMPQPERIPLPKPTAEKKDGYPKIYRVQQDPRYILYEYPDRYEIYFEDRKKQLKYVRTDVK
ncbi:MAG: hypothetical protein IJF71_07745 [Clostridia bacterium]|nr:hypothetical protein [Clostridia bacterium]